MSEATRNGNIVNDLAKRLADAVPPELGTVPGDLQKNFEGLLRAAFERMELVTREEFDVQRRVLERTREKLSALESELARLETEIDKRGEGNAG